MSEYYPWQKSTKCFCSLCASEGKNPYHYKRREYTGRGILHEYCPNHKLMVNRGIIAEEPEPMMISLER